MSETTPIIRNDLSSNLNPPESKPIIKPKINSILITTILATILFLGVSVVFAYKLGQKNNISTSVLPSPTILPSITSTPTISENGEFGKLTYLNKPEKVPNPSNILLPPNPETGSNQISTMGTYRVGNFSSGAELLIVPIIPEGPSSAYNYRFIHQKDKYFLIESLINDTYIKNNLSNIFKLDTVSIISFPLNDLLPPASFKSGENIYEQIGKVFGASQFITELTNKTMISSSEFGDLYSVQKNITNINDTIQRTIYLQLHDFTLLPLRLSTNLSVTDDHLPQFTYSNGQINTDRYDSSIKIQCGSFENQTIIKDGSPLLINKTIIGNTFNQEKNNVYQIKDTSNKLLAYLYNDYVISHSYQPTEKVLTLEEFASAPNHILFQDKLGDWELYLNQKYAIQAECGKPVIYLYPTQDTNVSVKVGANITKSEPLYPSEGWNVLAHPNGQLDYQSQTYPNLFWEGTGLGYYKDIGNYGFVVPQTKLISTLNSQLIQLGLNSQESADFIEYWTDKLPKTPYIRLSWLLTEDMNRLAPLQVSPSPKTAIRIFLDFEGLNQPVTLIPQKLSAPKRLGFTLVEWGGLLRK